MWIASATTTKKEYKGFFNNYDSIFVLLEEMEALENFQNFNKAGIDGDGGFGSLLKNC